MESDKEFQSITNDQLMALMDVYYSEWQYRDELLWNQVYKFFYAVLFVLFLPNIATAIGIVLPRFPRAAFPVVSFAMSIFFLYAALGYVKRLEASGKTYAKILEKLPPEYRRVSITSDSIKYGKYFKRGMASTICIVMFMCLVILSVVMFVTALIS